MSTRIFAGQPTSVDKEKRSFEITITTETPVREWIRNPDVADEMATDAYIEADVILVSKGLDTSRCPGMPLMDSHDMWSGIGAMLGKVEAIRIDGDKIAGTARLNRRNADLIDDIEDGFYGQISAGFGHNRIELEHRPDTVPLAYSTDWTLYEASIVPVGADPNAHVRSVRSLPLPQVSVRSGGKNPKRENEPMSDKIEELVEAAEDALAAVAAAAEEAGDKLDDSTAERIRKLREIVPGDEEDKERGKGKRDETKEEEEERKKREAEDEKKEEDEVRRIRALAAPYGLRGYVDDLVKLGGRSADIKKDVRAAIVQRAAARSDGRSLDGLKPTPPTNERNEPVIDYRAHISSIRKALG